MGCHSSKAPAPAAPVVEKPESDFAIAKTATGNTLLEKGGATGGNAGDTIDSKKMNMTEFTASTTQEPAKAESHAVAPHRNSTQFDLEPAINAADAHLQHSKSDADLSASEEQPHKNRRSALFDGGVEMDGSTQQLESIPEGAKPEKGAAGEKGLQEFLGSYGATGQDSENPSGTVAIQRYPEASKLAKEEQANQDANADRSKEKAEGEAISALLAAEKEAMPVKDKTAPPAAELNMGGKPEAPPAPDATDASVANSESKAKEPRRERQCCC